jgi:hypothetical protein
MGGLVRFTCTDVLVQHHVHYHKMTYFSVRKYPSFLLSTHKGDVPALDIQRIHPRNEERVEIRRRTVQEDISMSPRISLPVPGSVQVQVSGLGEIKKLAGLESYQISMGMRHHRNKA